MYVNFQAKTARVRGGFGVGFDNYQRSGVGPGLIWIIAKGPGYLKNLSRSHTSHLYQLSSKNSKGPGLVLIITKGLGWVRG